MFPVFIKGNYKKNIYADKYKFRTILSDKKFEKLFYQKKKKKSAFSVCEF